MKYIDDLKTKYNIPDYLYEKVIDSYKILEKTYENNGKILVCGNGGGASDSEHIVGELMKSFIKKRELNNDFKSTAISKGFSELNDNLQGTLCAISLVSQIGVISAFANDNNPDYVYAQQVYGYGNKGDTLIALTTSGNSKNIINAAKCAIVKGMNVISITNENGGKIASYSDVNVNINQLDTYKVQELTLPIYHAWCLELEEHFFK